MPSKPPAIEKKTNLEVSAAGSDRNRNDLGLLWPKADASWLDYHADILSDVRHGMAELKPLPTGGLSLSTGTVNTNDQGGYIVPYPNVPTSVLQLRAAPTMTIVLRGRRGATVTPSRRRGS